MQLKRKRKRNESNCPPTAFILLIEREMSELCDKPSNLLLMESAFRSFCSVIATHILAGQVDALLEEQQQQPSLASLARRLWWFARYFNPLNLGWRYYSILSFRCRRGTLSPSHLALLNFECFPFDHPVAYLQAEAMFDSEICTVKRLEISGIFSSQGMLSFIAAYQGLQAIQFTVSSSGFGFLPNVTKAMAILGLFRVMVSPWIANKVHVEMKHPAQQQAGGAGVANKGQLLPVSSGAEKGREEEEEEGGGGGGGGGGEEGRCSRALAGAWGLVMVCLVGLSMRSYLPFPPDSTVPTHAIDRSIEALYNYIALSALGFHGVFLWQGASALGNRHPLFNHPLYHLQTALFLLLLAATLLVGILDFVQKDFYRNCFY